VIEADLDFFGSLSCFSAEARGLVTSRGWILELGIPRQTQILAQKLHIKVVERPRLAYLRIIFALFWKTYDLLQSLKCRSRVHGFKSFTKQWKKCETVKGGPTASLKKRGRCETASFASPNVYPWLRVYGLKTRAFEASLNARQQLMCCWNGSNLQFLAFFFASHLLLLRIWGNAPLCLSDFTTGGAEQLDLWSQVLSSHYWILRCSSNLKNKTQEQASCALPESCPYAQSVCAFEGIIWV